MTGEFGLLGAPVCAVTGFHLALPSRWRDDLLLLPWLFDFIYYNTERLAPANPGNQPPMQILVDPARFELATFSMPLRRAPNCAMGPFIEL